MNSELHVVTPLCYALMFSTLVLLSCWEGAVVAGRCNLVVVGGAAQQVWWWWMVVGRCGGWRWQGVASVRLKKSRASAVVVDE